MIYIHCADLQAFTVPASLPTYPPVDLQLIFEKSNLKNQVGQTWFLVYFKLEFWRLNRHKNSSSKQTKNQVRPTWLFKLDYLKNILQIDRGIDIFLEILLIWFEWVER